ncbi:hypothetical protein K458DRAFT_416217 [Lentithecium fluviatile CBS 122367]|uniref:Uncharacterized protein n=1 Tax=Lentithecium fluviatile CBS 122367 TaxID=1168545 RepID=A0A6G1J8L6_9PLEO|nr:hypothetical protein K458DRAFT_416217 [Lentithecium fluviatile CBS 122367]
MTTIGAGAGFLPTTSKPRFQRFASHCSKLPFTSSTTLENTRTDLRSSRPISLSC